MWRFSQIHSLRLPQALVEAEDAKERRQESDFLYLEVVWVRDLQKTLSLHLQGQRKLIQTDWHWERHPKRSKLLAVRVSNFREEQLQNGASDHAWFRKAKLQVRQRSRKWCQSLWYFGQSMPRSDQVQQRQRQVLPRRQPLQVWNPCAGQGEHRAGARDDQSRADWQKCDLFHCEAIHSPANSSKSAVAAVSSWAFQDSVASEVESLSAATPAVDPSTAKPLAPDFPRSRGNASNEDWGDQQQDKSADDYRSLVSGKSQSVQEQGWLAWLKCWEER